MKEVLVKTYKFDELCEASQIDVKSELGMIDCKENDQYTILHNNLVSKSEAKGYTRGVYTYTDMDDRCSLSIIVYGCDDQEFIKELEEYAYTCMVDFYKQLDLDIDIAALDEDYLQDGSVVNFWDHAGYVEEIANV